MSGQLLTWKKVPIKEVYLDLFDGPHATPKPSDKGPVYLGIHNLTTDGRIDLSHVRHISEEDFPIWTKRVTPQSGDVVFTYEATLGRYGILPSGFRGCLGRRIALIRTNPDKVDNRFLLYYFLGQEWQGTIAKNTMRGATVDRIPINRFPEFPISLPSMETQRKITRILSAYSDLIENNLRRISTLEQVARLIYDEWFVKFKFPGHEKVKMVDSELGEIPEGWEVKKLNEVAKITDCLHTRKPLQATGKEEYGFLLHVWNIGEEGKIDLTNKFYVNKSDYSLWTQNVEVRGGDCVITNVGRIGAFAQIPPNIRAAIGRNMTAVRPREGIIAPTYLIEYLRSPYFAKERSLKQTRESSWAV